MSAIFRAIDSLSEPRYSVLGDIKRAGGGRRRSRRRPGAGSDAGMLEQVEPRVLLSGELLGAAMYADVGLTTPGLIGSYVDADLSHVAAAQDWRVTQAVAGSRLDDPVEFLTDDWGLRDEVGLTGGSDANWDWFSVQWDGFLEVTEAGQRFATVSDDASQIWIDVDQDGVFEASERTDNHWGNVQGATIGDRTAAVAAGVYPIRIQYCEAGGDNTFSLVASPQVPPQFTPTPTNPRQVVRVMVLNFDPRVPTEQNRLMHEVFNWSDPRGLAQQFAADLEWATGGAIDIQITEWRDLDAFPTFTDGFRYNPDEYVQFRSAGAGWHETGTDFYELVESQGLGPMVNAGQIDEIWTFGDHYFSLLGEAWMGGPNSFFINGPSYEDAGFDRAIAGYGFNYERGVAEMIHNLCHRTENHGQRAFGSWDLAYPDSAFDQFSSNYLDTAAGPYGVGTCHVPANADAHYDYGDPRTVESFALDFANYPDMTWDTQPVSPDTWRMGPSADDHRDYMNWYFSMVPRNDSADAAGRSANWFKYIWDFNSYEQNTGLARERDAFGAGPIVRGPGGTSYDLTVRYYDAAGVDAATLDVGDVRVIAPGGATLAPTAVDTGADVATTAGVARTATYTIEPPGGSWDVADNGTYRIELQSGEVLDVDANPFPTGEVGSFRVALYNPAALNVSAMLAADEVTATHTAFDIGAVEDLFDGNTSTLARTPSINPAEVMLEFDTPQTVTGFRSYFAAAWGDPAYEYVIEAADSVADLDGHTGSYVQVVPITGTPSDTYSAVTLGSPHTDSVFRLTGTRLTGDDYVHVNEWELIGTAGGETDAPTAALTAVDHAVMGRTAHFLSVTFTDATAVDMPSIANGDLLITGPGGPIVPTFYDVDDYTDGSARTATFWFIPPGGAWDYLDNGTYTIELQAGAVRDVLYNSAATPQTLGTFDVAITEPQTHPPADLAEQNASEWVAWAQGASASTADDTARTVAGAASVRFETTGGLDTSLTYPAPGVADWDLTAYADLEFSVYAENPSQYNFQEGPWVRLNGVVGGYFEYHYYENNNPATPLNGAIDQWSTFTVPLDPEVEPAGWRRTTSGTPSLEHIASVEFHADTWDSGFTLWYDGVSFTGGPPKPTANLAQPPDGGTIARATINTNRYIDVTFVDYSGSGLDATTILDTADEFTLSGPGVGTAAIVSGTPTHLTGNTYRYFTTGDFVAGVVNVDFTAGAWEDNDGTPNAAETESFTIEADPSVSGRVWSDTNSDGLQDAGEEGFAGAVAVLFDPGGDGQVGGTDDVSLGTCITAADGTYHFDGLSPGAYYLQFRTPADHAFAPRDAGGDDLIDSDADATGLTEVFTLAAAQQDTSHAAGLTGSSPDFGWAFAPSLWSFGGQAVTTDTEGSVYVTAIYGPGLDIDPGPGVLPLDNDREGFVAKYTSVGALVWMGCIGGGFLRAHGEGIALDDAGNVFVAGSFSGTADFDPGPDVFHLTSATDRIDVFVLKFDNNGGFLWAGSLGGPGEESAVGVAVDPLGNVCVTGYFWETIDLDPGPAELTVAAVGGSGDFFVVKLDPTGQLLWGHAFGSTDYDWGLGIATDSVGNVYATGSFRETVDFDPGSGVSELTSAGGDDTYVLKLNASGDFVWVRAVGGTGYDSGKAVEIDGQDNVCTTGLFSGTVDFDPGPGESNLTSVESFDSYVLKLDAAGQFVWVRILGGTLLEMAVDQWDNVYTSGFFEDTGDFDPGDGHHDLVMSGERRDAFVSKLDVDGEFVWAINFASTEGAQGDAVATDESGNVYVTGMRYNGPVDFDPGTGTYELPGTSGFYLASFTQTAIGGTVWSDVDGDGSRDGEDDGIAGVTVHMYRDDGDGVFEPAVGDGHLGERVTDGDGAYGFDGLAPGRYWVVVDDGSAPLADTVLSAGSDPREVDLGGSADVGDADFGYHVNHAPVAQDDEFHVDRNGSYSGVLVATDEEGDDVVTYRIETPPSHGSLTAFNVDTGAFTYETAGDYSGVDGFTFIANDTWADSNEATVAITVGPAMIDVTDSSADAGDAAVQFITALSQFRLGAADVALVRPTCPDEGQYIDVTNVGGLPLTLSQIQIAAPDVTVAPSLTAGDITLMPGETQRFALTYEPTLPSLDDETAHDFDLSDGLVIISNADNAPVFEVALRGASTFNSDITHDGAVNLGELGLLNANFGKTSAGPHWDPTADIDGDGAVDLGDLGPLNREFGRQRPTGAVGQTAAAASAPVAPAAVSDAAPAPMTGTGPAGGESPAELGAAAAQGAYLSSAAVDSSTAVSQSVAAGAADDRGGAHRAASPQTGGRVDDASGRGGAPATAEGLVMGDAQDDDPGGPEPDVLSTVQAALYVELEAAELAALGADRLHGARKYFNTQD